MILAVSAGASAFQGFALKQHIYVSPSFCAWEDGKRGWAGERWERGCPYMIAADLIVGASESTLAQDGFDLGSFGILGRGHWVCDGCGGEDEGKEKSELRELHD